MTSAPALRLASPDSPLASGLVPARGYDRNLWMMRSRSIEGIVLHTTGYGIINRWRRQGARFAEDTPHETALRVYATMMDAGPHYVVGQRGEITQTCPETIAAWHVSGKRYAKYRHTKWASAKHGWWLERWYPLMNPAEMPLWAVASPNQNTIGIEVVPPMERGEAWSEDCWASVVTLLHDIRQRREVPMSRHRILTHSDLDPLTRTDKLGRPWDTSRGLWRWENFVRRNRRMFNP